MYGGFALLEKQPFVAFPGPSLVAVESCDEIPAKTKQQTHEYLPSVDVEFHFGRADFLCSVSLWAWCGGSQGAQEGDGDGRGRFGRRGVQRESCNSTAKLGGNVQQGE